MCGIIGFVSATKGIRPEEFNAMRDTMVHRGPDGMGSEFWKDGMVAFGHRRLSIIDLSNDGAQPMSNADQSIWLTFNGEIYNFQELKTFLEKKYTFHSGTDSEVLIYGYQEWGIEGLLERIEGMFAFALYDTNKEEVFVARDRVGIKPLHYFLKDGTLIFASELKAIKAYPNFRPELNNDALASYFRLRYVLAPLSIYKDCAKLLPGHYAVFNQQSGELCTKCYYSLQDQIKTTNEDEDALVQKIRLALEESVQAQTVAADVPVHTFLSGGIDSSTITALVKKHNDQLSAYSIEVVDDVKNEIEDAQFVAKHLNVSLIEEPLTGKDFTALHNEIIAAYDEPLADTSCIPTYFLCQLTAQHVKVALSGDGGDELFYGYNWYGGYKASAENSKIPFESFINSMSNTFDEDQIKALFPTVSTEHVKSLFLSKTKDNTIEARNVHHYDFLTFMVDDILTKVDTASMAHSLETRVPFLDRKVIELAFSIDWKKHYQQGELKYLLKKASENLLPSETLYKKKKGFSVPSIQWLDVHVEHNLLNGFAAKDKVWNVTALKQILKGKLHQEQKWLLYNFERWYAIQFHGKHESLRPNVLRKIQFRLSK